VGDREGKTRDGDMQRMFTRDLLALTGKGSLREVPDDVYYPTQQAWLDGWEDERERSATRTSRASRASDAGRTSSASMPSDTFPDRPSRRSAEELPLSRYMERRSRWTPVGIVTVSAAATVAVLMTGIGIYRATRSTG
jgi:hypothetical protein